MWLGSLLIPFPSSTIHLTQPAIVDPASAGRWVCLQILNTTQGTFPLSFLGQVIPLYHATAAQWVRAHPLHYPPLLSPPFPCHVPPRYITRFASVTEWTPKKSDIFDPPLIAPYLQVCVWVCVCVCVCSCVACVYVWVVVVSHDGDSRSPLSARHFPVDLILLLLFIFRPFLPSPRCVPTSPQKQHQKNGSAWR